MKVGRVEVVSAKGDVRTLHGEPRAYSGAVVRCMADIEPEPLRWLWPGRIPGQADAAHR